MADHARPWSVAWRAAIDGFYSREPARQHFATGVMQGPAVAQSIADAALPVLGPLADEHGCVTVTDAGAANGLLLEQLIAVWPGDLAERTVWRALDLAERPAGLDAQVQWIRGEATATASGLAPSPGLVIAHEFLDDIPCDIVEPDESGRLRLLLAADDGRERLGPLLTDAAACAEAGVDGPALAAWCECWWPRREPAARIEAGLLRDLAWQAMCRLVRPGLAIAIDYAHDRPARASGRWDGGSLVGYHRGRVTRPRPDGSVNLTAHVALDACAAAVEATATSLGPTPAPDDFWWLVQWLP
ncbi:MAG: SAM-dependent methyltransferase [Actinomycetota bacterium]|nr:SAM-dependent methyltransferase [Actinomycetota bacterium]